MKSRISATRARLQLPLILVLSLSATLATIWLLYSAAIEAEKRARMDAVSVLASLTESVAAFDRRHSTGDDPDGALGATLRQLAGALKSTAAMESDGTEVVVGRLHGSTLQVLEPDSQGVFVVRTEIPYVVGGKGEPLRRALAGQVGVEMLLDYRGVPVLAAYSPIPTLKLGLVSKTDIADVRAPYLEASGIALVLFATMLGIVWWILRNREAALSKRLAESDRYTSTLTDLMPVIILTLTRDGRISYVNPAFEAITGWSFAEVEGKDWFSTFIPERMRKDMRAGFQVRTFDTPTRGHINPILTRRGEERIIEWYADGGNHEIGDAGFQLLGVGIDVTDVYAARAEATEGLRRLNEAQRMAAVGSWELDLVAGTLRWSDEIFRMFEIDPAKFDATYEAFLHAIHPDDRDAVNAAYTQSLSDRKPYGITHRLQMDDGRIKYVHEECESTFDAKGKPLLSVGTVQDITERVLAEQRITAQLAEKEVLLREIHHRVKNNLNVISSLLYLQASAITDERVSALFAESRDRVHAMALVHETLYQSDDLAHIDIRAYVARLTEALTSTYAASGRRIAIDTAVDVPQLDIQMATPVGLIISELATNALKHAFVGRSEGRILVALTPVADGATVRLTVSDDGVGMPTGVAPREGALGAKLVAALAEQLGGTATLVSGEQGTTYTLEFPA